MKFRNFRGNYCLQAKSQPNFRFYALYDKVYRKDVLIKAWQKVKANHGSPGIDGVTIEDIEEEGVNGFLKGMQEELKRKRISSISSKKSLYPQTLWQGKTSKYTHGRR